MKILLVIDNLNSGGAQRQLINLGVGLKDRGYEVHFLVYNRGNHFEEIIEQNHILIHRFFKRNKYDLGTLFKMFRFIHKEKYTAICAFLFIPSLYILMYKWLTFSKARVLISERSYYSKSKEMRITPFIRKLYSFSGVITANSISQTSFLKKRYEHLHKKIFYVPNGLKVEKYPVKTSYKAKNALQVVCVGHVNGNKNAKILIEAINILKQEGAIEIQVKWLGRTYEFLNQKNPYYGECIKLLENYGLSKCWSWEGKVTNVVDYLLKADVLIHPSIGEGFPNAICEALSTGLPVIASEVNDHPYIIKDKVNGLLFKNQDLNSLIEKISSFNNFGVEERTQMGKLARKTALQNFNNNQMIDNYENLLLAQSIKQPNF